MLAATSHLRVFLIHLWYLFPHLLFLQIFFTYSSSAI